MKKDKEHYFYFLCDTVHGKLVLQILANAPTIGDMLNAQDDVKSSVLHPNERILQHVPRKPPLMEWETFRGKHWAKAGFKKMAEY
jgi:hypothetical protein